MKMHQLALVLAAVSATATVATASSSQLVQAFVGFNRPNAAGLPCVNCLGYTDGTVFVQPNNFVSSNSQGLYYAVLQANGWTGDLSANFKLLGAGNVIQQMTLNGTITADQGTVVVSGSATIPQTAYSGHATLNVTTTATPSDGSSPFVLKSSAAMEVGEVGTHRLLQVFAGFSSANGGNSFLPCAYPECGPFGAVGVQPAQFPNFNNNPDYYVVFQAEGWNGSVDMTYDLLQGGRIVHTYSHAGAITSSRSHGHLVTWFGANEPLGTSSAGPATLRVTTKATARHLGSKSFTLRSVSPIQIQ